MMARGMRTIVAMGLLLVAMPVLAQDRGKAQAAYHLGTQHYNLGEYREALESFKEAYRNVENPSILFNIAQCHRQLGDKLSAVRSYRAYLNNTPDAANRQQVRDMIAKLESEIASDQKPLVTVEKPVAEPAAVVEKPLEKPAIVETSAPIVVVTPPAPKPVPVYKRWWLWTAVGVGVAAIAVGVGVGVATQPHTPVAVTDFGTFKF
jgi:tetratricopeptide (TPR) repeat protein